MKNFKTRNHVTYDKLFSTELFDLYNNNPEYMVTEETIFSPRGSRNAFGYFPEDSTDMYKDGKVYRVAMIGDDYQEIVPCPNDPNVDGFDEWQCRIFDYIYKNMPTSDLIKKRSLKYFGATLYSIGKITSMEDMQGNPINDIEEAASIDSTIIGYMLVLADRTYNPRLVNNDLSPLMDVENSWE